MKYLTPILIYLVVPIVYCLYFFKIRKKIKNRNKGLIAFYFWLLFTYLGISMTILTFSFWRWSGIASLGIAGLIFIIPIILIFHVVKFWKYRASSYDARIAIQASFFYIFFVAVFLIIFISSNIFNAK